MKSWSARSEQAKLYFERAQIALETVKVTSRRYPLFQRVEGIDPLTHRVSWVWRSKFGVGKKGIIHEHGFREFFEAWAHSTGIVSLIEWCRSY
jgi:hypothetical protein